MFQTLIGVTFHKHPLLCFLCFSLCRVLSKLCQRIGLCTNKKSLLGSFNVLWLALPCLQHWVLEGTCIWEGHMPWVGALVHSIQVQCGLHLWLASRQKLFQTKQGMRTALWSRNIEDHPPSTQENGDASGYNYAFNDIQVGERVHHNARNSWWHTSLQQCKCVLRNLFRCCPLRTLSSRSDHARLQENSLKQHMVLSQEEEHFWPDLLSNLQSPIDAVASIKKNLRLNNWHQSIILHMSR